MRGTGLLIDDGRLEYLCCCCSGSDLLPRYGRPCSSNLPSEKEVYMMNFNGQGKDYFPLTE